MALCRRKIISDTGLKRDLRLHTSWSFSTDTIGGSSRRNFNTSQGTWVEIEVEVVAAMVFQSGLETERDGRESGDDGDSWTSQRFSTCLLGIPS